MASWSGPGSPSINPLTGSASELRPLRLCLRGDRDRFRTLTGAIEREWPAPKRMPVPGSMWQPWLQSTAQGGGARADFFGNPVVDVDGFKVAPLICYEQLILWPVLQSMLHSPEVIVAVGNGWWTVNTSIVAIQKASVAAWARLFGLPVVLAFNT